ncbi:hypothetical protein R50072_09160 [Simiduia litorea]|uniref:hypothetical protein n=1 Tax=Simiduia litorea TaxID=1435348 RepID=UPI0036F4039C
MNYLPIIACLTALTLSTNSNSDDLPLNIKDYMSSEEASSTGVSTLSEQQLTELNRWLTRFVALDAHLLRDNTKVTAVASESVHTSIKGKFTGWNGNTIFVLENGQTWKQRLPGKWRTNKQNPQVVLALNALNLWELTVVENNKKIGVKRVK